jgi:Putative DNA-binding domain
MDAALKIFKELQEKGIDLVSSWTDEGYHEDLHLDFKRKSKAATPVPSDDDRRNYARSLSGFANSDGGVVVWGIGAPGSGTGVRSLHPIRDPGRYAESLDSLVSRLVSPPVEGVQNLAILDEDGSGRGYVVSYVPKSEMAPHRAEAEGTKQYYKRYGDSFKATEHYELEYMFGKRLQCRPNVFWDIDVRTDARGALHCELRIGVNNLGRAIARFVCLRARYDGTGPFKLKPETQPDLVHHSAPQRASRKNFLKVTARAQPGLIIYPNDVTYFFVFAIKLSTASLQQMEFGDFFLYYDLFAENFSGLTGQKLQISAKKIAEKLRKKMESYEKSG